MNYARCVCGGQRTDCVDWFALSTIFVLGLEVRSSDLAASQLTEPSHCSYAYLSCSFLILCSIWPTLLLIPSIIFFKKKISFSVLFSSRISDSFFKLLQSLFSFYGRILNCFSVFSWSSLWFLKTTMLNSLLGVGVSVLVVIALHFVDWAKLLFPENSCWLEHIVICGWRTITDCFIWTFSSRSHPSQGLGCCQYFSTRGHLKSKTVPPI